MKKGLVSSSMVDASSISTYLDLGIEIVKLSGLQQQALRLTGKTVFVTGLGGSGKTTFINYLQHGFFDDEDTYTKTLEASATKTFSINIGNRNTLKLNVKRAIEIPGQMYPEKHAQLAKEYKPKCILIIADLSRPDVSQEWIETFCKTFEHEWRGIRDNGLQSLNIALNKADKMLMVESEYTSYVQRVRAIMASLSFSLGSMPKSRSQAFPCSLVTNSAGTKLVDRIIRKIALDLKD